MIRKKNIFSVDILAVQLSIVGIHSSGICKNDVHITKTCPCNIQRLFQM